jgi:Rrf2 family protein
MRGDEKLRISTRGRYGLRAMLDIAKNSTEKPISILSIAERQEISDKYLEQIFPLLKNAGLIKSVRGPRGGYILGRNPEDITVGQVLRILEGSLSPVECVDDNSQDECARSYKCPTRYIWLIIKEKVENAVDSITLKDLLAAEKDNYVI